MPQAEGAIRKFEGHEKIRPGALEAIPFNDKYPQLVDYHYPEFSAVCPFSGLPDIARVHITLVPHSSIPELKALKYYFMSFRDVGIYQEEATDRIHHDLFYKFAPRYLKTVTTYNTRGGLDTTSVCETGYLNEALGKPTNRASEDVCSTKSPQDGIFRGDLRKAERDYQAEIHEWADRNFGVTDLSRFQLAPFLGMVEELGELAHSILKCAQGIRGTDEEHFAKMEDAIADYDVFAYDFCARNGMNKDKALATTWDEVRTRDWKRFPKNGRTE